MPSTVGWRCWRRTTAPERGSPGFAVNCSYRNRGGAPKGAHFMPYSARQVAPAPDPPAGPQQRLPEYWIRDRRGVLWPPLQSDF